MPLSAPRSSTLSTAMATLMLLLGCDPESEVSDAPQKSATPKETTASEPGWNLTYTGSEDGTISGKVSQITSVDKGLYVVASDLGGNSMTVGLAVSPSDKGTYDAQAFNITIDKELCEQDNAKPIKLVVTDGSKTSLAFTLSGKLACEGKRGTVVVEGTFRKK